MGRIRRSAYSVFVALLVFSVLSLPVLSQIYGPVVYLPVYAVVSVFAGIVTWSLIRWLSDPEPTSKTVDLDQTNAPDQETDVDVDAEIEQLKEEG